MCQLFLDMFESLLAKRNKHRKKKRKRSETNQLQQQTNKRTALESSTPTLSSVIASIKPSTTPFTNQPKSLIIGILIDLTFPHESLWESWHNAVQQLQPTITTEIIFIPRIVLSSNDIHKHFESFVQEHLIELNHPVRWGSINEVRAILTLMERAHIHVENGKNVQFLMCDSYTIPGSVNINEIWEKSDSASQVSLSNDDNNNTDNNSNNKSNNSDAATATNNKNKNNTKATATVGYSRDIQFQCISNKIIDSSHLKRISPWGMIMNGNMIQNIVKLEAAPSSTSSATSSTSITSSTSSSTKPCWYKSFQAVPCASEIYFATIISMFDGTLQSCCTEQWERPIQFQTDSMVLALQEMKPQNNPHFHVLRRITSSISIEMWSSVLDIDLSFLKTLDQKNEDEVVEDDNNNTTFGKTTKYEVGSNDMLQIYNNNGNIWTTGDNGRDTYIRNLETGELEIYGGAISVFRKSKGGKAPRKQLTTTSSTTSTTASSFDDDTRCNTSLVASPLFPMGGGKSQRSAWFSDDYLISIDPPACGIGNKFFIYSAYRIYSSIYQKEMNIHNKTWLDNNMYHLSLSATEASASSTSSSSSSNRYTMTSRTITKVDRALVLAVFQKTTMYLQWSPLILSWKKDIYQWFQQYVEESITKSIETYNQTDATTSKNDIGGKNDLVIHLRTGDIWEERVKTANVANGGFIYYTQPPAWFYSYVVSKYKYKTINVLTHVPNSQYVLAVVSALQNVPGVHTVRVLTGTLQSDFGLLLRANNLIPSISTFSWWGIFLGDCWHKKKNQNQRTVHIGRTGFWHPNSIHQKQFCFQFDSNSTTEGNVDDVVQHHEYILEQSDTWQNTNEQRAKAFSNIVPDWFVEKY